MERNIDGLHDNDIERLQKLDKIDNYDSLLLYIIKYVLENQIYYNEFNESVVYFYKKIINKYYEIKESIKNETDKN